MSLRRRTLQVSVEPEGAVTQMTVAPVHQRVFDEGDLSSTGLQP